jgi:hypothetical protein
MPECLLGLCAHVTGYRPILQKWETNDFSRYTSYVSYPGESLLDYAYKSFRELKHEQAKLIGKKKKIFSK